MTANEWIAYSTRARLRDYYGYEARVVAMLLNNQSAANVTEHSSQNVVPKRERKRIDYPGGTEFIMLKADGSTSTGDVTADIEVEVP